MKILFADNLSIFRFDNVKWLSRFYLFLHNKDNKVHIQIFKKVITCKIFFVRSQFRTATSTHYLTCSRHSWALNFAFVECRMYIRYQDDGVVCVATRICHVHSWAKVVRVHL